ncbi:MAG: Nif3-like dinuclear metal center hexameric protein [Planctomycetota bacterium]
MSVTVRELEHHLDELLEPGRFRDHCANGLQVEGDAEVERIATAATASLAACRAAREAGATALLVHHGVIWGGAGRITGVLRKRLSVLLGSGCNLLAYHLPLDAHPSLGNNALALARLGAQREEAFAEHGGTAIGYHGCFDAPITIDELIQRCERLFDHPVCHCPADPDRIARIGVVTGGGAGDLGAAAAAGCQALITGEPSEPAWHEARELGCHLLACGHYATENLAIHELGARLAETFQLGHLAITGDNPI